MVNDQNSSEHLSGWPEVYHDNPSATVVMGHKYMELKQYGFSQPRSITVRTDVIWHEPRVYQGQGQHDPHLARMVTRACVPKIRDLQEVSLQINSQGRNILVQGE